MQNLKRAGFFLATIVLAGLLSPLAASASDGAGTAMRDGQHDFDFNLGDWNSRIKRVMNPLSGANDIVEMRGTVKARKVWGGAAQIEEMEADGSRGHWQGLTLFLYNPKAHQWKQLFSNSADGALDGGLTGSYRDGNIELYAQDTFAGRAILVRCIWSDIKPDSHHFEEAFSDDGGKTWHPWFSAELTRMPT